MSERGVSCASDLTLERFLAGELAEGSVRLAHVRTCAACAARLEAMRAAGAGYMESDAADGVRKALAREGALSQTRRARPAWWWGVAAPLAAAAMWLAFVRAPPSTDLVSKGSASVALFVGHGASVVPWTGGALAAGDAVQLSWTSPHAAYVAVIGRDEGGETIRWFPAGDTATRLEAGTRTFGDSLRFDAPFRGTITVFVSETPFSIGPLEAAVREGREPVFRGEMQTLHVPQAP